MNDNTALLDAPEPLALARIPRILVVDDEPGIREFVDRTLQLMGYETIVAADGESALAKATAEPELDLLLTDLQMPGLRGDELARKVREKHPATKVLYVTGFSNQLFQEKGSLLEGEAYLDKPVAASGLLQAVSLLLYGNGARLGGADGVSSL